MSPNEVGRQRGKSIVVSLRPAILNRYISAFYKTAVAKAFQECSQESPVWLGIARVRPQHTYDRHRLLSLRRNRQCRRAGQGDEFAAVDARAHSMTSSARASMVGGTSKLNAFAVLRLRTVSNLVGACT